MTQVLLEGSNETETLREEAIVTEILREEGIDTYCRGPFKLRPCGKRAFFTLTLWEEGIDIEALQEEFTDNETFLEGPIQTGTLPEEGIVTEVQC